MLIDGYQAIRNASNNKSRKFPRKNDKRLKNGMCLPNIKPKFSITFPTKVFTLGSCFARNIEEALLLHDVELPTRGYKVPHSEWSGRSNGILHEYNPGTMTQWITSSLRQKDLPIETIVPQKKGSLSQVDLLLPHASKAVYIDRAIERRKEIDIVYLSLIDSDYLIITLGLSECWFDKETNLYLNAIPPNYLLEECSGRYEFRVLDVNTIVTMLDDALYLLLEKNAGLKILLTVSPVPLTSTFTKKDSIISNCYSKSVLRVSAEAIVNNYSSVDYFPSYEIVMSMGSSAFMKDNIHVKDEVVRSVTRYMVEVYNPSEAVPSQFFNRIFQRFK